MKEQANLAQQYGNCGFVHCFYWFGGKTLTETPIRMMQENKEIDILFCLTWANESWTRQWDGKNADVQKMTATWQDFAPRLEGGELYLIGPQMDFSENFEKIGFDSLVEFARHGFNTPNLTMAYNIEDPDFEGGVFDYQNPAESGIKRKPRGFKVFCGVELGWDNAARRLKAATVFVNFTIRKYREWLRTMIAQTRKDASKTRDEKNIFIIAWSEWAEATHLEPDQCYGFAFLDATRQA